VDARPINLAALVIDACEIVERESPHALVELAEKLKKIADGGFQQGDFRISLKLRPVARRRCEASRRL
jgi:hypothetical protein